MLLASLDPDPSRRRATLAAVAKEMNAWLACAGHAQEGPVTRIIEPERTRPIR